MNQNQLRSLSAVLDYFLFEEEKHWVESGRPDHHIYHDLNELKHYEKATTHAHNNPNNTLFIGTFNDGDGDDGNWFMFAAPAECDRNQALKDYYKKEYDSELPDDEIEGVYPVNEVYDHTNNTEKKYTVSVTPLPANILASHGK